MEHIDKPLFAALMGQLGEVFSKKITPPLIDVYWEILSRLPSEKFEFAARHWMANGEHFPKPVQLREVAQATPKPQAKALPEPDYPEWLRLVNLLFFQWLWRQHAKGRRVPDLAERRAICRRLARDFELMEREGDPQANRDWLRESFDKQMALLDLAVAA